MRTTPNDRGPKGPDEIELSPGTLAEPPLRINVKSACGKLREALAEEQALEREIAERRAAIEAKKAAARVIQDQYNGLIAERADQHEIIRRADLEVRIQSDAIDQVESTVQQNWRNRGASDWRVEVSNRKFLLDRLPKYKADAEKRITELDAKIAAFGKEHGVPESV